MNSIFLVVLCSVNTAVNTEKDPKSRQINLFLRNIMATQSHFAGMSITVLQLQMYVTILISKTNFNYVKH